MIKIKGKKTTKQFCTEKRRDRVRAKEEDRERELQEKTQTE